MGYQEVADAGPPVAATRKPSTEPSPGRIRRVLGIGVPQHRFDEVRDLRDHILARLQTGNATTHAPLDTNLNRDWLRAWFFYPLLELLGQARRDAKIHFVVNVAVIAGGFATSGIAVAAGRGTRDTPTAWAVFAVGLLVAVAGGVNQLFRPGARAVERKTLETELREEGWTFALKGGVYDGDVSVAFPLFRERVAAIYKRATHVGAAEMNQRTRPRAGKRRSGSSRAT